VSLSLAACRGWRPDSGVRYIGTRPRVPCHSGSGRYNSDLNQAMW